LAGLVEEVDVFGPTRHGELLVRSLGLEVKLMGGNDSSVGVARDQGGGAVAAEVVVWVDLVEDVAVVDPDVCVGAVFELEFE
jgi:hypothetical protein